MWNYRIVEFKDKGEKEPHYKLCEVYYNDKKQPCGCADADVGGETLKFVRQNWEEMAEAFMAPVLKRDKFVEHDFDIPRPKKTKFKPK